MKKFVIAALCSFALVGFVIADEFTATLTKVDGNKIEAKKGKKGEDPTILKLDLAKNVKVAKGMFDMDTKKWSPGEEIKDGLKSDTFTKIGDNGMQVRLTVADDGADKGKVTQILVTGKGGKKKGG